MAKIVVIENDSSMLDGVVSFLSSKGYEVIGAINVELGLETIYAEMPDLIICDLIMPDSDGHKVTAEVRSDPTLEHIPILYVIDFIEDISEHKRDKLKLDDYRIKPIVNIADIELLQTIRNILNKNSALDSQIHNLVNILNSGFAQKHEKLLFKSRMIAMFSHDFRNPLATILASSNILKHYEDRLSPERKIRHYDKIDASVQLLLQMLEDMLMVAELDNGHLKCNPELININKLIHAIATEFRLIDQNNHHISVQARVPYLIQADPKILRQILSNLLSNAIKYAPQGSEIKISASLNETNGRVSLSVKDEGIGIPEDNLAHVFDEFFRASNVDNIKGTGLGLSIVKECVERHDGIIEVVSDMNQGTEFVVEFPLVPVLDTYS